MRCDPCFLLQPPLPCPTLATLLSLWSSLSPEATGPLHVPFLGCSSHLCLGSSSIRPRLSCHFRGAACACVGSGPLAARSQLPHSPRNSSQHSLATWTETFLCHYRLAFLSCYAVNSMRAGPTAVLFTAVFLVLRRGPGKYEANGFLTDAHKIKGVSWR